MAKGGGEPNTRGSIAAMVVLRAFLGSLLLANGLYLSAHLHMYTTALKMAAESGGPLVSRHDVPAIAVFLTERVANHVTTTAWVLIIASIVLGALLILGLCTRATAFLTLLLHLFVLLLWGPWLYIGLGPAALIGALWALLLVIAVPGRVWGLDALIIRRARVPWLW
jgi:uncharacterized membrane protein YphA (DoxX/SURF4 family)